MGQTRAGRRAREQRGVKDACDGGKCTNRPADTVEASVNLPWSEIMSMKLKGFETL